MAKASEVLKFYAAGHSLEETARKFGVSKQAVHQRIQRLAPDLMRPAGVNIKREVDAGARQTLNDRNST